MPYNNSQSDKVIAPEGKKQSSAGPQVTNSNNSVANSLIPKHITKRIILNLGIFFLIVVACLGGYLHYRNHQNHTNLTVPDPQTYTSLSSYSVKGAAAGEGMSFKLPPQFTELTDSKIKVPAGQMTFLQHSSKNVYLDIGGAQANSSAYINNFGPSQAYLTTFNDDLQSHGYQFLVGQRQLATSLLKGHFAGLKIAIQHLGKFTNNNIQKDSWSAGFIIDDSNKQPIQAGQLIYAITNNATYSFYVYSAYYNWTTKANQTVWQQVINSLKVDQ